MKKSTREQRAAAAAITAGLSVVGVFATAVGLGVAVRIFRWASGV